MAAVSRVFARSGKVKTWEQPAMFRAHGSRLITPVSMVYAASRFSWFFCITTVSCSKINNIWPILWSGVDLFFVLSGFLITGILFDSVHAPRFFKNFYIRRSLRIIPLFYGIFLIIFILTPVLHLRWSWSMLSYPLYCGNLILPWINLDKHNPTSIMMGVHGKRLPIISLGTQWSLCVEEQFYLLWPAVVWLVRDRVRLMYICIGMVACTLALRTLLYELHILGHYQNLLYTSTYTRWDTLFVGGGIALWLRGRSLTRRQLRFFAASFVVAGIAIIGASTRFNLTVMADFNGTMMTAGLTGLALMFGGVLLFSLDPDSLLTKTLSWRPLAAVGSISYGFYLFHGLPQALVLFLPKRHSGLYGLILFISSLSLAALSFRFYESPFLKLKNRWAPQEPKAHPHVPEPQPITS